MERRRARQQRREDSCASLMRTLAALDEPYWMPQVENNEARLARLIADADLAVELVAIYCPEDTETLARSAVEAAIQVALTPEDQSDRMEEALSRLGPARRAFVANVRALLA